MGGFVDKHNLTRLSFEMWVSLPNQMDQALHIYSRLQSSNATSLPIPLDDVTNWKVSFPSLRPIVDNWSIGDSCDIILLEASFRLMNDFPPKFSKLGISLELDFLHSSNNNGGSLAALDDWSCKTHMFRNGRFVKEVAHDDCHVAGVGKVKPFFESKWWASTFTNHTERRKMAEDSKSDGAIELANEYSRNFFRGLTVMQEISAQSSKGQSSKPVWSDHAPRRKRMAILLWKFRQAPDDFVGTTTWQKVIPPPERLSTNNQSLSTDMGLPALTMNSIMDGSNGENVFNTNDAFSSNGDQHNYALFNNNEGAAFYHDDFMDYRSGSMAGFEDATFDLHPNQMTLDQDMDITFDIPSHDLSHLQTHPTHTTTNLFELPQLKKGASELKESIHSIPQHDSFHEHDIHSSQQPLAKFDMNTHKMLQAQLGTDDDPFTTQPEQHSTEETDKASKNQAPSTQLQSHGYLDSEDEALRAALLAASAMSDLGSSNTSRDYHRPTSEPQHDPLYIPTSHPFTSPSTLAVRPPLQAHHSFAGTSNVGLGADLDFSSHHHNHSHSRNSSKNDFASILANLQAYNANHDISLSFDFGPGVDDVHSDGQGHEDQHATLTLGVGMGISRPQSQPILPTVMPSVLPTGLHTGVSDLYEEIMGHGLGTMDENANDGADEGSGYRAAEEHDAEGVEVIEEEVEGDEGFVVVKPEDACLRGSLDGVMVERGHASSKNSLMGGSGELV